MTDDERFGLPGTSGSRRSVGSIPPTGAGIADPVLPQASYSQTDDRFGFAGHIGIGGAMGGAWSIPSGAVSDLEYAPETISVDIDLSSESSKDVTIPLGMEARILIFGRLYIDQDPGTAFDEWCQYTFYSKSAMTSPSAYYRNVVRLAYSELEQATTGTDANITPDDHLAFAEQDLVRFLDDDEMARVATFADTLVAEDNVGAHSVDTGIVRVSEFSGFVIYNDESGTNGYFRVLFESAQTVSLKLDLVVVG